MRIASWFVATLLAIVVAAPAARAQTHVISKSALDKAVQDRAAQVQADRDAVMSLLQRAEVREIAGKAGLSLTKAEAAVATLDGDTLRDLASQARQVQNDLAGGASTIVISTTAIIIILLLVLILLAA